MLIILVKEQCNCDCMQFMQMLLFSFFPFINANELLTFQLFVVSNSLRFEHLFPLYFEL